MHTCDDNRRQQTQNHYYFHLSVIFPGSQDQPAPLVIHLCLFQNRTSGDYRNGVLNKPNVLAVNPTISVKALKEHGALSLASGLV